MVYTIYAGDEHFPANKSYPDGWCNKLFMHGLFYNFPTPSTYPCKGSRAIPSKISLLLVWIVVQIRLVDVALHTKSPPPTAYKFPVNESQARLNKSGTGGGGEGQQSLKLYIYVNQHLLINFMPTNNFNSQFTLLPSLSIPLPFKFAR